MFRSRKKKTSFEPSAEELDHYIEPQHEPRSHQFHHEHMSRLTPQQVLNNLANSSNDFAAGIAICIKALAEATAGPPTTPIIIEYRSRRMAFGRKQLARMDALETIKMAVRTIYPHATSSDSQRFVLEAALFSEDGRADRRNLVSVDVESWGELIPHIHSLYLRNESTAPRDVDRDRDRDRYRDRDRERDRVERERYRDRDRDRERPRRESVPPPERREERPQDNSFAEPAAQGLEGSHSQNGGLSPGAE